MTDAHIVDLLLAKCKVPRTIDKVASDHVIGTGAYKHTKHYNGLFHLLYKELET